MPYTFTSPFRRGLRFTAGYRRVANTGGTSEIEAHSMDVVRNRRLLASTALAGVLALGSACSSLESPDLEGRDDGTSPTVAVA